MAETAQKTEPTEMEIIEMLEKIPTERLFREYLHRVIRRGHEAPNDPHAVASLLGEFDG